MIRILAATAMLMVPAAALAQDVRPGYYIAEFVPADMERLVPYSQQVEATFSPYGGRYAVRGGAMSPLEGEAPQGRFIMIAFDDVAKAHAWYRSDAYQALIPIRQASGETNTYIVEGLPQ